MSGYTDSITLVAPQLSWWPPAATLSRHPLLPERSFVAAVTQCESPVRSSPDAHGLSRLGISVFLNAEWIHENGSDAVVVCHPFSDRRVRLPVCPTCQASRGAELAPLALRNGIRIRPATAAEMADAGPCMDTPWERVLWGNRYQQAWTAMVSYLTNCCSGSVPSACRGQSSRTSGHLGLLVSGDPGVGKHTFLRYLARRVPRVILGPHQYTKRGDEGVTYTVEHRCLNFADILAMDAREAVEIVRIVLQPPPVATRPVTEMPGLLIVVRLYHVDLLWRTSTNEIVDIVSSQLCASIDHLSTLDTRSVAFTLCSVATDPSVMGAALMARLAHCHVKLQPPTAEERTAFLKERLAEVHEAWISFVTEVQWESLSESYSTLSTHELSSLEVSAIAARLKGTVETHAASHLAPPSAATLPSSYRTLFGMATHIAALEELVVWPITHLRTLARYNIGCVRGVLVCGPSGCGKTVLLRALSDRLRAVQDCHIHVMMVDGLSLVEKEVGRSEKNIARIFETARARAPTALFLDNLDSLAPPRGRQSSESTTASDRTLSALLMEMDGVGGDASRTVVVVASAPSADSLDAAVRRRGRLDVHLSLPLPSAAEAIKASCARLHDFLRCLLSPSRDPAESSGISDDGTSDAIILPLVALVERRVRQHYVVRAASGRHSSSAEVVSLVREVMLKVLEVVQAAPGTAAPAELLYQQLEDVFDALLASSP